MNTNHKEGLQHLNKPTFTIKITLIKSRSVDLGFGTGSGSGHRFGLPEFLAGAGFREQRSHKIGFINDSISITIFGIGSDREWPGVLAWKNPLRFFKFQPLNGRDHPTHNRQVEGLKKSSGMMLFATSL